MPHMHPVDPAAADRVGDVVQGVTDHAVATLHAGLFEYVDDDVRHFLLCHDNTPGLY
jgi:hypothetical protein